MLENRCSNPDLKRGALGTTPTPKRAHNAHQQNLRHLPQPRPPQEGEHSNGGRQMTADADTDARGTLVNTTIGEGIASLPRTCRWYRSSSADVEQNPAEIGENIPCGTNLPSCEHMRAESAPKLAESERRFNRHRPTLAERGFTLAKSGPSEIVSPNWIGVGTKFTDSQTARDATSRGVPRGLCRSHVPPTAVSAGRHGGRVLPQQSMWAACRRED